MIEIAKIQSIIDELRGFNRIDKSFFENLDRSFESQTLNIGVVGKMKAGKSSLLNAVIFGDEILPAGPAPVTVTLTEITYGDKNNVIVEFMTQQDIEEIKEKASYKGEDTDLIEKADAANELLNHLSSDYEKHIGKPSISINYSELNKFVDANGEFSGLAKSVKIYLKNDNLKGITIIDTPGFNDPITSRGETTKKALANCHVLLFVHNKDGYDLTDKSLLVDQIEYAGISEVIDILNKVDMLQSDSTKWPDELKYFVNQRNSLHIEKESVKRLLENSHATYTSSLMALCGLIPFEKLSEDMQYYYGNFEEDFEELGNIENKSDQQDAFIRLSNVHSVISEINRLAKDGASYLINGPLLTLKGKLTSVKERINTEIQTKKSKIDSLNVTIDQNKKNLESFSEFMDIVMKKAVNSSIENDLLELIKQTVKRLQNYRSTEAAREFNEDKYPDSTIISSGVTKANIANYNTFITGFDNSVRDMLNDLVDSFVNTCKKEINDLILGLSGSTLINKAHVDVLKTTLINHFTRGINDIQFIIELHKITQKPSGNQKQWDKLRSTFLGVYDDKYICDYTNGPLAGFKQYTQYLDYATIVGGKLDDLRAEIESNMNKSPLMKQKEIETLNSEIENLEEEITSIDTHIKSINELSKNV